MSILTQKQKRIYDYIAEYIKNNGYSPSIREIACAVNLKSTSTVFDHLKALERKGCITRQFDISRSIKIVTRDNQ